MGVKGGRGKEEEVKMTEGKLVQADVGRDSVSCTHPSSNLRHLRMSSTSCCISPLSDTWELAYCSHS